MLSNTDSNCSRTDRTRLGYVMSGWILSRAQYICTSIEETMLASCAKQSHRSFWSYRDSGMVYYRRLRGDLKLNQPYQRKTITYQALEAKDIYIRSTQTF